MASPFEQFILFALTKNLDGLTSLDPIKRDFSLTAKIPFLRNPEIKKTYDQMVKKKKIQPNATLEKLLINKKIRTLSGVAVVAVLTKPFPCPGRCLYCPDEKAMPKSYLSNEPAVMRAILSKFDPYSQVQARLKALQLNGHAVDKIELIVMGGTFSYLPKKYQFWFIRQCFKACNDYPFSRNLKKNETLNQLFRSLESQQKRNEQSVCRIVGLTLETRPDYINREELKRFRQLGATRVELGVQHIDDRILRLNRRGHLVQETIAATRLLKEAGFKINYHLMPGLLGSTPNKDKSMFKKLFSDPSFQPDMVKIYPCVVTRDSELYRLWKEKKYRPLSNQQAEKLLSQIKSLIPPYVRITRLIRDIPEESILAGPNITNLRQLLKNAGVQCQCIRCREVRSSFEDKTPLVLDRIDYPASGAKEIFLQFISPKTKKLYALLRLRIPHAPLELHEPSDEKPTFPVLVKSAIIRELHTYGKVVSIQSHDANSPQHIGLGKKLVQEAERISREEFGLTQIAVISGVGVRGYYRRLGYRLKNTYMLKTL